MSDVDDDAHAVAAADHLGAELGEAAANRRHRLDVAELVDPVVGQLKVAEPVLSMGLLQPFDPAFKEVGAFGGDDGGRSAPRGRVQRGEVGDDVEPLVGDQLGEPGE